MANAATPDGRGCSPCDAVGGCEMRQVRNALTEEIQLHCLYVCVNCYKTHVCDLSGGCVLVATVEGSVCLKTGLVYESLCPATRVHVLEPTGETSVDDVNVVGVIMSSVYSYLMAHATRYADVIQEVVADGHLKKQVEDAVYFTFNRVFRSLQNVQRISVPVISQLFTQLIIGIHAKNTKYDSSVIKVSRRKREDALLKQMRFEYGNAPVFGS
ncbi:protein UL92 [Aotine betaherpesvirus 1]|uniref:Protein UL92 n=1 Tax=Aotine betaherpesvirus 1 TaxID=50290 RepID=G8XUF7_9BETA|nr:protein UL92 [Aotine betaherpesvirus 1]AEV80787.1 protein UL92 [Aotine betaherpesvirus 1]